MTLSDILSGAYEETGYDNPGNAVRVRFTRWVNEGVRAILGEPGLMRLADSDAPLTVSSTASTARLVLPEAVARIRSITERTNDLQLQVMSLDRYRLLDPDATSTTGTPTHYVPIGSVAVATQPSDASELFVKSTSSSDTGTAYVEGVTSAGLVQSAAVTMTGTTAVSLSSLMTSFVEVTDFYVSQPAVGSITLHEDSGSGTELARIGVGATRPRYYGIYLWPTPASALTYYVDYRRETTDLVMAMDEPPIPTDFHPMLVTYVVMRERNQKADTERYVIAKKAYDDWLSRLKYHVSTLADEIPVSGRQPVTRRSRLGAWYPVDTWN